MVDDPDRGRDRPHGSSRSRLGHRHDRAATPGSGEGAGARVPERDREQRTQHAVPHRRGGEAHGSGANIAFEQTLGYETEQIGGQVALGGVRGPFGSRRGGSDHRGVAAGEATDRSTTTPGGRARVEPPVRRLDVHPASRDRRATALPHHRRRHHGAKADRRGPARVACAPRPRRGSSAAGARAQPPRRRAAAARRAVGRAATRRVEARGRPERGDGAACTGAREELTHALEELRELARGIHPAVLTDRGLRPALETLASRAPYRSRSSRRTSASRRRSRQRPTTSSRRR